MAIRLSSSSANTRRNKSNSNVKFTTPPHRRSTVLGKHPTQQIHREFGQTGKSIRKKFLFDIQTSSINRRSQILYAEKGQNSTIIYLAVEYNKKLRRRHLRQADSRCFFGWPSPFGPRGRIGENKAQNGVRINRDRKQIR
jgi:hypothetical protein